MWRMHTVGKGVAIYPYTFLTLALEWGVVSSTPRPPCTEERSLVPVIVWVGPRAGLNRCGKEKVSCPPLRFEPWTPCDEP